ncbi:MAG: hypothetical protein AAF845_18795 [Bacteroidota bacterium]
MPDLPEPADRRPPLVPPHIAWPAFIVFLLAISITMAVATFVIAKSDGGPRLVDAPAETRTEAAETRTEAAP